MGKVVTVGVSDEREFATVEDLLRALDYAVGGDRSPAEALEDYVLGYLDEDLGINLVVNVAHDSFHLIARMSFYGEETVNMWSLEFPTTTAEFRRYLDELDHRIARLRVIVDLPTAQDLRDSGKDESSIRGVLARLFQTTDAELVDELGDDWVPVDSNQVGIESQPVRFLVWAGQVVVGLDDEYLNLFMLDGSGQTADVGAAMTSFELGDEGTMSLRHLSTILQGHTNRG